MSKFNEEILNAGLNMAMEFGPNLHQPINQRLKEKFPQLEDENVIEINQLCYSIRDEGVKFVFDTLGAIAGKRETISNVRLEALLAEYLSKYLWINKENRGRILSQGCYYVWKDGFIDVLTP